jgi:hypothetical protein
MPIVFNPNPGEPTSNSFASISEFDDYLSVHLYSSALATQSTPRKQSALMAATRTLSTLTFCGTRALSTQALHFPLTGQLDVPYDIKAATFELAIVYLSSPVDPTLELDASAQGISSISVAKAVSISFRDEMEYRAVPMHVRHLVLRYLCDPAADPGVLFRAS